MPAILITNINAYAESRTWKHIIPLNNEKVAYYDLTTNRKHKDIPISIVQALIIQLAANHALNVAYIQEVGHLINQTIIQQAIALRNNPAMDAQLSA